MHCNELDRLLPPRNGPFIAYKMTCLVTGKVYIGITRRSISERWADHRERAFGARSKTIIAHAIAKHGPEQFVIEHIASAFTWEGLLETEIILIAQENTLTPNGYNARPR